MWTLRVGACLLGILSASAALADDWTAVRLRGQLEELVGQTWQPIARGAAVHDGTMVRSLGNGYADFVRGNETVSVSPNTQIAIADEAAPGSSKPYTTVTEYFGTVSVEADVENVKHFAVDTPYLAAVVKGTKFLVSSGASGASVTVDRGRVAVTDVADHSQVVISVGQTASVAHHGSHNGELVVIGNAQSTGSSETVVTGASDPSEDSDLDGNGNGGSDNGNGNGVKSDDGKGNGGVPGNGNGNGNGGPGNGNGSDNGNSNSGKSDNGKGNGGVPGNGKGKEAEVTLWADWLSLAA